MKENDNIHDDFLKKLIQKTPLDEPSGDFVNKVMASIQPGVEMAPARKPFFLFLKSFWLYAVLSLALIVFLMTSDLPFTQFIPGKGYISQSLLPYFENMFSGFRGLFVRSEFTNIGLMVLAAGALLFLFDHLWSRRSSAQHHPAA